MLLENQQRSPEHLALNPQGFVPALEVGGKVLTQSLAIIDWLDARHPEPRLIPADPDARAAAMAQALVIAADTHPLNNLRVMRRLKAHGHRGRCTRRMDAPLDRRRLRRAGGHGGRWTVPRRRLRPISPTCSSCPRCSMRAASAPARCLSQAGPRRCGGTGDRGLRRRASGSRGAQVRRFGVVAGLLLATRLSRRPIRTRLSSPAADSMPRPAKPRTTSSPSNANG
jgi:hypothetical protein